MAHEVVHPWTADRARADGPAKEWLSEGGADALAERALLELGMLDPVDRAALLSEALFDCRLRVRDGAAYNNPWPALSGYSCGNVIGAWSELALGGRPDVFGLWQQVVAGALLNGDRYDEASYLRALAELGVPPASVDAISRFVRDPPGQMEGVLTSLADSGLRWQEQAPPPAARVRLGRLALGACSNRAASGRSSSGRPTRGSSRGERRSSGVGADVALHAPGARLYSLAATP